MRCRGATALAARSALTASGAASRHASAAAPKAPKAPKAPRPPKAASAPLRAAPGVTLGDLVRCGKLAPGMSALTSLYKGETYAADLGPSGARRRATCVVR